ncbi:MAG: TatD family hydrolase [Candidatus Hydrothermarchaeales archaeon]
MLQLQCEILTGQTLGDVFKPAHGLEFTDNHMHIDPREGKGIEAVREFEDVGGKYLFLVNKGTGDAGIDLKDAKSFEKLYEYTIGLCGEIREKTGVHSYAVIGVHPAEFASMCKFSIDKALETAKEAMDIAGQKIADGKAVAMGEIGMPHFDVKSEILDACRELLSHSLEIASGLDCAVQLHTGSVEEKDFMDFSDMAKAAGLEPRRLIKHYSPPLIRAAEEAGIYPSLIASSENIKRARKEGNRFLMESDYIDDLSRPGAVVGPKSVPKVSRRLFEEGVLSEEDIWRIHLDNVQDAYGINLD